MSTLYITEYHDIPATKNGFALPAGEEPNVAEQSVAITGSSVQSNPFNPATSFVMVSTDSTCSLAFGTNPTASTNYHRMAANETRFYGVMSGMCVAVIANT